MGAPGIFARRLRATLQEPVDAPDGIGGTTRSFVPRITLWARLEPSRAQERGEAQAALAAVSHRLTIRWRGDVTVAMRFAAGASLYRVIAVYDPDGRRRNLVCLVEEVQP